MSTKCLHKHTKYQPKEDEWFCPKCGSNNENFIIDLMYDDTEEESDCNLLHEKDMCVCFKCNFSGSGKVVSEKIRKKNNLVPCPCCKGTGFVDESTVKETTK